MRQNLACDTDILQRLRKKLKQKANWEIFQLNFKTNTTNKQHLTRNRNSENHQKYLKLWRKKKIVKLNLENTMRSLLAKKTEKAINIRRVLSRNNSCRKFRSFNGWLKFYVSPHLSLFCSWTLSLRRQRFQLIYAPFMISHFF